MSLTKLEIFNLALVQGLGERPLANLSEDREPKRVLDAIWTGGNGTDGNAFIRACLEQGYWNFAMRSVKIDSDSSVTTGFGYQYAFSKPSDFVKLAAISAGEYFTTPLNRYEIEMDYIFADVDPLYLRFVSDHTSYGGDLSKWPESFTRWVANDLALRAAPAIKSGADMERLEKRTRDLLRDSRSKDAQQEPTRFLPLGTWASARLGQTRSGGRRDGGSRSVLIG